MTVASERHTLLKVGTSNIVLPGIKRSFPKAYQTSSRLTYYASLFNTLEVNSSFYKIPRPATVERWSDEVPNDFRFTFKLWKQVTHASALFFAPGDIDYFMKAVNGVADEKKGCLLIQFPASITIDFTAGVASILKTMRKMDPGHCWRICVELRHKSWYNAVVYAMLDSYRASLVLHDMPASALSSFHTKADIVYLRFHGIKGDYKGSYEPALLQQYATSIKNWLQSGKEVYAYFNNTIGNAFENAQQLRTLALD